MGFPKTPEAPKYILAIWPYDIITGSQICLLNSTNHPLSVISAISFSSVWCQKCKTSSLNAAGICAWVFCVFFFYWGPRAWFAPLDPQIPDLFIPQCSPFYFCLSFCSLPTLPLQNVCSKRVRNSFTMMLAHSVCNPRSQRGRGTCLFHPYGAEWS